MKGIGRGESERKRPCRERDEGWRGDREQEDGWHTELADEAACGTRNLTLTVGKVAILG